MAIWMQAGNVAYDNLSDEQAEVLDNCEPQDWVEVVDGDWSLQREIDLGDVITTAELTRRVQDGETEGYICFANVLDDQPGVAELKALADDEATGYFSGDRCYLYEAK
jgi:hypothetical protein